MDWFLYDDDLRHERVNLVLSTLSLILYLQYSWNPPPSIFPTALLKKKVGSKVLRVTKTGGLKLCSISISSKVIPHTFPYSSVQFSFSSWFILFTRSLILLLLLLWISLCFHQNTTGLTPQKFSIKDFFSKWDQIRSKLRIWSHLLKNSLMENFVFCAMTVLIVAKTEGFNYTLNVVLQMS